MSLPTDAQAIIIAGQNNGAIRALPGGGAFTLVPEGAKVEDVSGLAFPPMPFARANFTARTPAALVKYIKRHATPETSVFADVDSTNIVAVIDYHSADNVPGRVMHRAMYTAPISDQWDAWSGFAARSQSQWDAARFLEENAIDVVTPDGATLLEIVKTLEAAKRVDVRSGIRLDNGNVDILFKEVTEGTAGVDGKMTIPTEIKLGIPVFYGCAPYGITAFFRYRINEGKLSFNIDLHRKQEILAAAFGDIVTQIQDELGDKIPVYEGTIDGFTGNRPV